MPQFQYKWYRSELTKWEDQPLQNIYDTWEKTCNDLGKEGWQLVFLEIPKTSEHVMFVGMFIREIGE